MVRILVSAPDAQYPIDIEAGVLARLATDARAFGLTGHVVIVSDSHVAPLYGEALARALPDAHLLTMPAGEQHKTLETVRALYEGLLACGADRKTTLLALGGGVVGDTAGFVAATYMRGIALVQLPTTLLAMVDAGVGGKVGVDMPQGKNLIGAFKQPQHVLIDPDVLATLPAQEWRAGMAEVLKHGLLADPRLLDSALHAPERAAELIARAVQVKVDIVQADPYEQGVRAHLNLGHTFAHAIERVTQYTWLHGEAVAVGLLAATMLSQRLGLCDAALVAQVAQALAAVGLPQRLGGLDTGALYAAMATDKKWQAGRSRFVLLAGAQQPRIVEGVPREDVIAVLEALQ